MALTGLVASLLALGERRLWTRLLIECMYAMRNAI